MAVHLSKLVLPLLLVLSGALTSAIATSDHETQCVQSPDDENLFKLRVCRVEGAEQSGEVSSLLQTERSIPNEPRARIVPGTMVPTTISPVVGADVVPNGLPDAKWVRRAALFRPQVSIVMTNVHSEMKQSATLVELLLNPAAGCDRWYRCSTVWMTFALCSICIGTLLLKWVLEVPRRRFETFALDCSKQVVAIVWYRFLTIAFLVYERWQEFKPSPDEELHWYFVCFIVDSTAGVVFMYIFIRMSEFIFRYKSGRYSESGYASRSHRITSFQFCKQMAIFCVIIGLTKFFLLRKLGTTPREWHQFGEGCLDWVQDREWRLLLVLYLVPLLIDGFYFCVVDEVIKCPSTTGN